MNRIQENKFETTQVAEAEPERDRESKASVFGGKEIYLPPKDKTKPEFKYDLRLLVIGGGIVLVLLLLAVSGISHTAVPAHTRSSFTAKETTNAGETGSRVAPSITPILDTSRSQQQEADSSLVDADQIARTANQAFKHRALATNLGEVPPFEKAQAWQAPPYQPGTQVPPSGSYGTTATEATSKNERDALDKSSLVFVKNIQSSAATPRSSNVVPNEDWAVGLRPGTRLRARLESAVSTAVQTPVAAVIEYNYEQNGEIVVPAGAKAFGHLEAADRSGYVGVRFDSLMLPDGSSVALEAVATDLQLRPLRGRVEGKHTGKNVVVRSFAGVGEIAATLVGRGSLNQPLSEGDLMRERLSNNIGQAGDQEVANLAITEHLVVSVPADTEIYVVLRKPSTQNIRAGHSDFPSEAASQTSIEELRQLLKLQHELNETATTNSAAR
jgi:hypothetical protein